MLVKTASLPLSYLLLVFFNGYLLVNGDKGGTNIVVQGKSHGEGGGGSVVVNSPKKGAQNIVIRDYRGTVVLNSHKKGGANIVVNSHEEKKPHHHHHEHHEQHHEQHHEHHGHHAYESPKMLPMLGESGSTSSHVPSKLAFGARTVKPYESEETGEEEQLEPTPTVSRKRKGGSSKQVLKKKLKAKVVREQSEETEDEQPKIRGRAKGDAEPEAEQESEPEADSSSSDAYSPSVAEEDPYSGYRDGPGPIPQTDRKGLRDLEKGVEYGVEAQVEQQIEQQIEQGLLGQMGDESSSDSNSGSSNPNSGSSSSGSSGAGDSSSLDNLGLTGSDSGSDSPGYFASGFPSVDSFNTDSLKGLTLSDALFGTTDKDSSGSGLLDFPWTRRSDNPATINTENKSTPK